MMRTFSGILTGLVLVAVLTGCSSVNVGRLQLGMEPEAVQEAIGKPYTIRAAKVYPGNDEWAEIWEYLPPIFTLNPKTYWVHFENGKVVQWGEPGDFSGKTVTAVKEYNPNKSSR